LFLLQDAVDRRHWMAKSRFYLVNENMVGDPLPLITQITAQWQVAWHPGATLVIDESVYEYEGECACRQYSPTFPSLPVGVYFFIFLFLLFSRYIPRKPHPNGLLSHGISGWTAHMRLPMLLDIEPHLTNSKPTPREAARLLVQRTRTAHPNIQLHVVMDSGFGSFDQIDYYCSQNVLATVSLSSNQWKWLFNLLGSRCPWRAAELRWYHSPFLKRRFSLVFTKLNLNQAN
jgi:hypothetical protein